MDFEDRQKSVHRMRLERALHAWKEKRSEDFVLARIGGWAGPLAADLRAGLVDPLDLGEQLEMLAQIGSEAFEEWQRD